MHKSILFLFIFLTVVSCNLPTKDDIPFDQTYAIPLLNDKIRVQDLLTSSNNLSLSINAEGEITLLYVSELIDQSINEILPSISSVGEIPIPDTVAQFTLVTGNSLVIKKAIFNGDEIRFRYASELKENISVVMRIPELSKDGVPFEDEYLLIYDEANPVSGFTESVKLDGYEFSSTINRLTLNYDARNVAGERIKLDFAAMSFNELQFAYGEGSFSREEYFLQAEILPINVYAAWQSGTLEFDDPSLKFTIDNSFGFPISFRINEVDLTLIDDEEKNLIGDNVGIELELAFPSLNEVGESASTSFDFDKSNSNLNTLINEKVKSIRYSVDAIINPLGDTEFTGFVTDQSFFNLRTEVELPLKQKIEDFLLTDTIEIQPISADAVTAAELKIVTANSYPTSMELELEFLDEDNLTLFSMFKDELFKIDAGELQADGTTLSSKEVIRFVDFSLEDLQNLKKVRNIVVRPLFDSSNISEGFLNFYEDQFLELRMGLIFKL